MRLDHLLMSAREIWQMSSVPSFGRVVRLDHLLMTACDTWQMSSVQDGDYPRPLGKQFEGSTGLSRDDVETG